LFIGDQSLSRDGERLSPPPESDAPELFLSPEPDLLELDLLEPPDSEPPEPDLPEPFLREPPEPE
jgi:hypothetical protein